MGVNFLHSLFVTCALVVLVSGLFVWVCIELPTVLLSAELMMPEWTSFHCAVHLFMSFHYSAHKNLNTISINLSCMAAASKIIKLLQTYFWFSTSGRHHVEMASKIK